MTRIGQSALEQNSAPTHPGNSRRPWQWVGLERPTSGLEKEDLSLRLLANFVVVEWGKVSYLNLSLRG